MLMRRTPLTGGLLLFCLSVPALPAHAVVKTTTAFGPPRGFGYVLDGRLFEDSPYPTKAILEVRIVWDIVVEPGYDAADIDASVLLPIQYNSTFNPWPITPVTFIDGDVLGWSGSGAFSYTETIDGPSLSFGAIGTGWGHQALGLADNAAQVLATSRIEIDYIDNLDGDTDDDGEIDDADLGATFAAYTGPVGRDAQKTALDGDTDGDGDVDDADLGATFAAYTGPITPLTSVPEPTAALALVSVGLGLCIRRRRGRV